MGCQLNCELAVPTVKACGPSWALIAAFKSRSNACFWKIRMALGCTVFPPGATGMAGPRANPRFSHVFVMPIHWPAAFLYSTRNQPSTKGQVFAPAAGTQVLGGRGGTATGGPCQVGS